VRTGGLIYLVITHALRHPVWSAFVGTISWNIALELCLTIFSLESISGLGQQ